MPVQVVIDTTVLQKANALISGRVRSGPQFARRVQLLDDIRQGRHVVLYSRRLLAEYERQVRTPRNDFVQAFFQILNTPGRALHNWAAWPPSEQEKARKCRYPKHDDHVLRTAIADQPTTIVTEDQRMIRADACIYRCFRVHIVDV